MRIRDAFKVVWMALQGKEGTVGEVTYEVEPSGRKRFLVGSKEVWSSDLRSSDPHGIRRRSEVDRAPRDVRE